MKVNKFNLIDPIALANYILAKIGDSLTHLKLQKLSYYIEAWHLAVFGESLINDDFEAWLHGPVNRKIWEKFKHDSMLYDDVGVDQQSAREIIGQVENDLLKNQVELIEDVLSEYGGKSSYYLECLTHSEDPWIEARRGVEPGDASNNRISRETMKSYYESRLG